jgi:hypothetical protein
MFILICVFFLSGLTTKKIWEKVYVGKGAIDAYMKSSSGGKAMYTVLFCGSADGTYLPPMTVYKGSNHWAEWEIGGPEGACYGVSPKGWMLEINLEKWFTTVFVKFVKNYVKPVLLVYYGHNSHLTFKTCKAAVDSNIILVCLPPNTSHTMQPFDVAVFKSVKTKYSQGSCKNETVFICLLKKLLDKLEPMHLVNGFRASGLLQVENLN